MRARLTHRVVYIVAKVCGRGFLDMARYDSVVPANEEESYKIARTFEAGPADWIIFRRFVADGCAPVPNVARWRSFNQDCDPRSFDTFDAAETARNAHQYEDGAKLDKLKRG